MDPSPLAPNTSHDAVIDPDIDLSLAVPSHKQMLIESSTTKLESENSENLRSARKLSSSHTIGRLGLDLLLIIPPICFLTYAFLVYTNRGKQIDKDPVPALQNAAKYGPTIFPIVFAAIIGNLLKAVAAWKLERGITILNLEFLLSSRTVFSTITTPFSLRTVNVVTLCLIALWSLSPLGGQAAFRVIEYVPNSARIPYTVSYLEMMSNFPHTGPWGSSGSSSLPAILGAFIAALSAPANSKAASQDLNGNIKIPMLEALESSHEVIEGGNWFNLSTPANHTYSAIAGLPVIGYRSGANCTFSLDTSYMYTDCSVSHINGMSRSEWLEYINTSRGGGLQFNNGLTLSIEVGNTHNFIHNPETPLELVFTSFTDNALTNATCKLTTTYVEVDVFCNWSDCKALRVRRSENPRNQSALTVLDGLGPSGSQDQSSANQQWYLMSLINATNTPWAYVWGFSTGEAYSTPLEYYFTHPDSPYLPGYMNISAREWQGADIYPIGDIAFSQRFSQLLNTFWMANIAPTALMGDFVLGKAPNPDHPYSVSYGPNGEILPDHVNVTGIMTPDYLELTYHEAWLAILIIASVVMLSASLFAAGLGALRKGPDLLDRTTMFLRDNHYARVALSNSMEDGFDQARKSRSIRLCIGDARHEDNAGYVAVGTLDIVKPISRVHQSRLFE